MRVLVTTSLLDPVNARSNADMASRARLGEQPCAEASAALQVPFRELSFGFVPAFPFHNVASCRGSRRPLRDA
jgi:hypothetical protein